MAEEKDPPIPYQAICRRMCAAALAAITRVAKEHDLDFVINQYWSDLLDLDGSRKMTVKVQLTNVKKKPR